MHAFFEATNMRPSPHPQGGMRVIVALALAFVALASVHAQIALL